MTKKPDQEGACPLCRKSIPLVVGDQGSLIVRTHHRVTMTRVYDVAECKGSGKAPAALDDGGDWSWVKPEAPMKETDDHRIVPDDRTQPLIDRVTESVVRACYETTGLALDDVTVSLHRVWHQWDSLAMRVRIASQALTAEATVDPTALDSSHYMDAVAWDVSQRVRDTLRRRAALREGATVCGARELACRCVRVDCDGRHECRCGQSWSGTPGREDFVQHSPPELPAYWWRER
ncbi:hypothetical protein [Streptomyces sp. NPDC059009]|uniref:hypothetical protein n=1 Tax=Streptomyces sp. NPDC059009 TaxID=3346694 RepID=UPI0036B2E76E